MSALGHLQTFGAPEGMSAPPPKADIAAVNEDVRFGPQPDLLALTYRPEGDPAECTSSCRLV
jgi:hypothetical protein